MYELGSDHPVRSISGHSVISSSLSATWEESIRRLITADDTVLVTGDTAGDFLDWEAVTLIAMRPSVLPTVSERYEFPELVDDYRRHFAERQDHYADFAMITNRLYAWPMPDGSFMDQVAMIKAELRSDPGSRRAMASVWNPAEDLSQGHPAPLGQCFFQFAIRNGALNMTVVSRSVDAWLGEVPNMVAFAELQHGIAADIGLPIGLYRQFILSYHIYLTNLPMATMNFPPR
jgi:hypothetical protein